MAAKKKTATKRTIKTPKSNAPRTAKAPAKKTGAKKKR